MTNLYFGITVDNTKLGCSPRTPFCPCSKRNRLCLNCGRIEHTECECPCECPKQFDTNTKSMIHFSSVGKHENVRNFSTLNESNTYVVLTDNDTNPWLDFLDAEMDYLPCPMLLVNNFKKNSII